MCEFAWHDIAMELQRMCELTWYVLVKERQVMREIKWDVSARERHEHGSLSLNLRDMLKQGNGRDRSWYL